MPCAFNAANEAAVNAFLSERCAFLEIMDVVEEVMSDHVVQPVTLEGLLETDRWARERVEVRVAAGVR
jgi:1-deoxy-D-xylulose-5-phosphate reductoisomerase